MSSHQTVELRHFAGSQELVDFLAEHGFDAAYVSRDDCRIEDGELVVTRFRTDASGNRYIDPADPGKAAAYPPVRVPAKRLFVPPVPVP